MSGSFPPKLAVIAAPMRGRPERLIDESDSADGPLFRGRIIQPRSIINLDRSVCRRGRCARDPALTGGGMSSMLTMITPKYNR